MGSWKMTSSLIFCLSIFALFPPSLPSQVLRSSHSHKVSVGLYYESLCPYSANFIVNYLVKLFDDDLISIVDLKLVPWGNAKLRGNNTFDCQHGPYECLLNTVEACAIDIWPDLDEHFPFIYCVEALVYDLKYREWESCFQKLDLDPKPIDKCYTSKYGKELELKYAAETNALQPPHKYVPWVVVDGEPLYEDYENFISYICKAYKGTDIPKSCSQVLFDANQMMDTKSKHSVCDEESVMPNLWELLRSTVTSWMTRMNMPGAA
ncbi:gamma-interferon-responsive lysosomal thiol protein-like [Neltuma alba]|uniref:gamma-interferon-responsive lysosomal thiol protein-like n=1 Tax=Neltuma alba TaxID=207710 RepID=UPI0010A2E0B7|nr:gamma-interferon-responsive lysosomal thiol protein-like [Prosopis alba]XP_028792030.1 gamma-interferon-responsive lysosomal thiol protein-like [Prosopis alba]